MGGNRNSSTKLDKGDDSCGPMITSLEPSPTNSSPSGDFHGPVSVGLSAIIWVHPTAMNKIWLKESPWSRQLCEGGKGMEYRCVKCGFRIKTLFVQYSPGNIRLMKCVIYHFLLSIFPSNFQFFQFTINFATTPPPSLYLQENCRAVADEYIECEIMVKIK